MTQATTQIGANQSGLQYRNADNDGKRALLNHHKGSSAPSYSEAGIIWLDDTATPWILKIYDGTDWIVMATVNASTNAVEAYHGTAALRLLNHAADTGSANVYAVAPAPAATAYAAGQIVTLKPANASTGAATLNVNGLGARNIKTLAGADPASGALAATGVYQLVYDGTNFVLLNPSLGTAAYLTAGTSANNLVQLDGAAKLPAVDGSALTNLPASPQELVLIATAAASGSSTLDFTSKISSSYSSYFLVFDKIVPSTASSFNMVLSTDNGSTWTAALSYQKQLISVGGSTDPSYSGGNSPALLNSIGSGTPTVSGFATLSLNGSSDFSWNSYISKATSGAANPYQCYVGNADIGINAIRFQPSAGNFTSGNIYMYGVKNA